MFEDIKWVIRVGIAKDRQHNGKKEKKDNDLQNTTQKINDRVRLIQVKSTQISYIGTLFTIRYTRFRFMQGSV